MITFKDYCQQITEACWKTHKQDGYKTKGKGKKKRTVPNCVRK